MNYLYHCISHRAGIFLLVCSFCFHIAKAQSTVTPISVSFPEIIFNDLNKVADGHTSSSPNILGRLINLVNATPSGDSIFVSIYQFDYDPLITALKNADQRGVAVHVLIDSSDAADFAGDVYAYNSLRNSFSAHSYIKGVYNNAGSSSIDHNKTAIFTHIQTTGGSVAKVVFNTSNNFTLEDTKKMQDAQIFSNAALYDTFRTYWSRINQYANGGMAHFDFMHFADSTAGIYADLFPKRMNGQTYSGDVIEQMLDSISAPATAKVEVVMSDWSANRLNIVNKLAALRQQGADVRVFVKTTADAAVLSALATLSNAGAFVKVVNITDNSLPKINNHSKFMTIDGLFNGVHRKMVLTGSHNYTWNALYVNNETLMILVNDSIYNVYDQYFRRISLFNTYPATAGPVYPAYPEPFEAGHKDTYQPAGNVTFASGSWYLKNAMTAGQTNGDRFYDAQSIRFQNNADSDGYLQMNEDVDSGATEVGFYYGTYGSDMASSLKLQYSLDGGNSWMQIGGAVNDANTTLKKAAYLMDIRQPVRFRIVKPGLISGDDGTISNGRINVDNFYVKALLNTQFPATGVDNVRADGQITLKVSARKGDAVTLFLTLPRYARGTLVMTDMNGRTIWQQAGVYTEGTHTILIPGSYASGIYTISFHHESGVRGILCSIGY